MGVKDQFFKLKYERLCTRPHLEKEAKGKLWEIDLFHNGHPLI